MNLYLPPFTTNLINNTTYKLLDFNFRAHNFSFLFNFPTNQKKNKTNKSKLLAETILGKHSSIEIRSIHLGGLFHAEEEIQMTSTMANFVGQMQGFVWNGER